MLPVNNIEVYTAKNIVSLEQASALISKLKEDGKKVGLCHGGFDLLHPGQIKHFESAKGLCDFLFVSITSDQFVSSRKGSGRPIFSDVLRAYMVANLKNVDYVIISNYKSGIETIKQLKPSFYIKGPDFINKNTPGINAERQTIEDLGGKMMYTHDPKLGTTEIIDYIKNKVDIEKILLCIDRDGTLIEEENWLGKEENWKSKVKLKDNFINLISFLQTKYKTRKIVVSNQAGVARNYFSCNRVEEINSYINGLLLQKGIKIDDWQYCPDVDKKFADYKKEKIQFNPDFIKDTTKRKPGDAMVLDGLKKFGENISDFSKIIVFGDRDEDAGLASNLKALYIDSKENERYEQSVRTIKMYLAIG
ncbi:MAG: HAD-IIIA family hydrolase [Candidatus Pacearchaeota archaeon]|nr:HAD-IIIA family hydrolase [Candidatus Pacearchaeota archaeon]